MPAEIELVLRELEGGTVWLTTPPILERTRPALQQLQALYSCGGAQRTTRWREAAARRGGGGAGGEGGGEGVDGGVDGGIAPLTSPWRLQAQVAEEVNRQRRGGAGRHIGRS